ncbi:hypothetical protein IWZ01DRAFT_550998 [Phyllosticta capitalensis]
MASQREPNSDPNYRYQVEKNQKDISAVCCVGLALALIFVVIRILIRTRLQRQFSTDDYVLILATVLYCVLTGLMITGFYKGGFGRATHELSYHVLQVGVKFLVVCEVTYIATSAFVKLSVAILQLRIIGTSNTTLRRINFLSTAVNVIISFYTFFLLLFQCIPPRKAWSRDVKGGHCVSKHIILTSAHVWSGVSIGLDVYYAVGLIPLIWGLQIPRAVKCSTIIILGLGIFASVATIARFKYAIGFADKRNPLGSFGPIAMWSNIEIAAGLIATSMYTFRPLLRLLPCRLGFSSNDTYEHSHSYGADPFTSSGSALHKLQTSSSVKKLPANARERDADADIDADLELAVQSHQRHLNHHYPPQHRECVLWGPGGGGVSLGTLSLGMGLGLGTPGSSGDIDSSSGLTPPPRAPETLHRSSGNVRPPATEHEAVNVSLGGTLNGCSESAVTAGNSGSKTGRGGKAQRIGSHHNNYGRGSAAEAEGPRAKGIWKEETVEVRTVRVEASEEDWVSADSGGSSPRG